MSKAFLLCAGRGTRFEPHSCVLPKVLIPFLNVPLVAYNLCMLKLLGVGQVIANVHGPHSLKLNRHFKTPGSYSGFIPAYQL